MQLDLFPPPPPPPVMAIEPESDPVVEALIAAGIVKNDYLLFMNRSLTNHGWIGVPSRMFRFPVEFVDRSRTDDGKSQLWLQHPDLATLPFVIEIFEKTGLKCEWKPLDEFGRNRRYHHAVDLCTRKHWRDLLATRNYTDDDGMLCAVRYALDYDQIDTRIAREILAAVDVAEPKDQSELLIAAGDVRIRLDGKVSRPDFRWNLDLTESVWLRLHAIERGYIKHKGGFMYLTASGVSAVSPSLTAKAA